MVTKTNQHSFIIIFERYEQYWNDFVTQMWFLVAFAQEQMHRIQICVDGESISGDKLLGVHVPGMNIINSKGMKTHNFFFVFIRRYPDNWV